MFGWRKRIGYIGPTVMEVVPYGAPIVAYTPASFFAAFKALGIADPIEGHGRLLASLAARHSGARA